VALILNRLLWDYSSMENDNDNNNSIAITKVSTISLDLTSLYLIGLCIFRRMKRIIPLIV